MILPKILIKDSPQYISFPSIHGGEHLQRVFFIGVPGHCFVCGRKGHLTAGCTRRRILLVERQAAVVEEQNVQVVETKPQLDGSALANQEYLLGSGKFRSEAQRARRRAAKKKKTSTEGLPT